MSLSTLRLLNLYLSLPYFFTLSVNGEVFFLGTGKFYFRETGSYGYTVVRSGLG